MIRLTLVFLAATVCLADKATYSAEVTGKGKILMDLKPSFSLEYENDQNKTATNTAFNIGEKHTVAANMTADNDTVTFTIQWGPDATQSRLVFMVKQAENKSMVIMANVSTFTTKENGFLNVSEPPIAVSYAFPIKGVEWTAADKGFKCNAASKFEDGKSSLEVSNLRVQVFQGGEFEANPKECSADTPKTTTTVAPPSTTTTEKPPAPIGQYGVPVPGQKGDFCVLLNASIVIDLDYEVLNATTNTTHSVSVRKEILPSNVSIQGTCIQNKTTETMESITINFNETWSLTLNFSNDQKFTKMANGEGYTAYGLALTGTLPADAVEKEKSFTLSNHVNETTGANAFMGFLKGSAGKSVSCKSYQETVKDDKVSAKLTFDDVRFEAFFANSTFDASEECVAPGTSSDLIPIIVGACLAALVVIVLVAYLIGRARARRGGYQSV